MRVLFVHQNCPGQFKHLAPRLAADPGNEVLFITQPGKPALRGVKKFEYAVSREVSDKTHHYLRLFEQGVLRAQAVARVAQKLKNQGFTPDVIYAHMGWGEALYLKDIWPGAKLLGYFEWFYHAHGTDADFDREDPMTLDDECRLRTRNGLHLLNLETADWGVTPTRWQRQQHPAEYHHKMSIIHEGVDVDALVPDPAATVPLNPDLTLRAGDEVVTYVSRRLEPYRGFPHFMRAAGKILERRPRAHILVVGADGASYGRKPKDGRSWRENMLDEVDLDRSRIHFLGRLPYHNYQRVLQVSAAHVYLTVPFVLSWSMLEAMASGCLVIGSATPPVQEVISDGENGLLVDFFSPGAIADRVDEALDDPEPMAQLRADARQTIKERYALNGCLDRQRRLLETLARGQSPAADVRPMTTVTPIKNGARRAKRRRR